MKHVIQIDFLGDVICPWCYIAMVRLEKAMALASEDYSFEYCFLPFQLYPDLPESGSPLSDFRYKSRPGAGAALRAEASQDDITLDYQKIERVPNSKEALRLILLADDSPLKNDLIHKIFKAYFSEGLDIGEKEVLIDLALEVRIGADILRAFDDPETAANRLPQLARDFRSKGISSVPTLILNKTHQVIGLQPIENYLRYFKRLS